MAKTIDGKSVAADLQQRVAARVSKFRERTGRRPGLATILVGDDPASNVYVSNKRKLAAAVGIADFHRHLPADATFEWVKKTIVELADDPEVSGILLQLPLPEGLDSAKLIEHIPVGKDVDGLTTTSAGLLARAMPGLQPCTPGGVIKLLESTGVSLDGLHAVVVGRSALVGGPMAQLLVQHNATVTIAHSRSIDLPQLTRQADLLIAAAGVPGLITAEHVKPGAIVVDVGIHRTPDGLVGDVKFDEVAQIASWITPVPGGVGPMTIALLLENTIDAAETMSHPVSRGTSTRP